MTTLPRGFTLLEIMVVLVLVGIITSFALLSVGGGPRERLAEEARRLAALVELHQQEAERCEGFLEKEIGSHSLTQRLD